MKHTSSISRKPPIQASEWQDITCFIFTELNAFMESKGATAPVISYMAQKCFVPPAS
jgi:hypothetical protein